MQLSPISEMLHLYLESAHPDFYCLLQGEPPAVVNAASLLLLLVSPIEAAADDAFYDPVIGGGGGAYADAEVDLPVGREVQIDGGEELLLLIVETGNVGDAAVVGVVLEAAGDLLGEVVADFGCWSEVDTFIDIGAVPGALEGRVDGEVPAARLLIDDGANLPGPRSEEHTSELQSLRH